MMDRRAFVTRLGLLGVAAATLSGRARADAAQVRSVSFVHTHTGEKLKAEYWQNGDYQPQVLEQVNHLLRDWRNNEVHAIDPALLDVLFDLRSKAQSQGAFHVTSAYRSPKTNAMLHAASSGVAEHSMHMQGKAIDVRLEGFATERLAELARDLRRGGVGYYHASDFVHVDTGRVRYWYPPA
jgi:uncharacterized protein YcbK (DUF882 family)